MAKTQPKTYFGITKITGALRTKHTTFVERGLNALPVDEGTRIKAVRALENREANAQPVYDFRGTYPVGRRSSGSSGKA